MAKKITITGSNHLTTLADDWGGVNNGTTPVNIHGTAVPAGAEWGMNRGEVERFIKAQLGTKGGDFRWYQPSDANYFTLLVFATAADAAAWDEDHSLTNYIRSQQLPIAATSTDIYSLVLSTSRTGSTAAEPIVIARGKPFVVPLRVLAWHYPPNGEGDPANYDRLPQILVQRSANGETWDDVGSVNLTGIASSPDDDSFPNLVDIGSMMDTGSDGAVMVRFTIPSYVYTNAAGETATMTSNRVVMYLRTVTLGVSMATTDWISPIRIADTATSVPVRFTLQGSINKVLHVKFTDASGNETYEETTTLTNTGEYDYTIKDDAGTLGTSNSGVHTLTAWVTYGSGADMISSDVIVHQLLVLKPSTASAIGQRVLVQQMAQTVDNFVQSVLCHYWVWNPVLSDGVYINNTSENVPVRFVVADTPNLSQEHMEYVSLPVSVIPGTDCTLVATMEVETATAEQSYLARLHALSANGTAMLVPSRQFTIDNTAGFQPTAGSVFHMNPKSRDNDEATPKTILNARDGNAVVASIWSDTFKMDGSDGWVTDDAGEKVLRIPSGRQLTISYNPLNHFYTAPAPSKSLTFEMDFQVNNITNEDDPIVRLCESAGTAGHFLGLRLLPMTGTMGSVTNNDEATTDFRWAEGRRQHLAVTITPSVQPNNGDARYTSGYAGQINGTINLVRVYLNGVIVREIRYNPSNPTEFCTGALSNGGIIIGQTGTEGRGSGCDIDIYSIRVWESGLAPKAVLQNYVSGLPGSTEKRAVKAHNDIIDETSGRISLRKSCDAGKTCMIWHGVEVMYGDDKKKGWLEIRRYDYDGNFLPQYSGSFCKNYKKLSGKGQGTTAMTYFYWNIQWKFGDIGYDDYDRLDPAQCLVLTPSQINGNYIHMGTPVAMDTLSESDQNIFANVDGEVYTHVCPVYGGNLGKDEPVGTGTKYYPCTVDGSGNVATIMLPDGWINGSGDLYNAVSNPTGGLYCGQGWQAGPGLPFGSKHVIKINYASSMQNHLIGINWLYDALHKAYCGANSLQRDTPTAVVAKQVVPVMFFTADVNTTNADDTDGTAIFRGLGGFGPGKMDKPSWGYSKKASKITDPTNEHYRPNGHDYFAMFEGAVNNSVLSDQIAPWDDTDHLDAGGNIIQRAKVKYFLQDPVSPGVAKDPECFYYRHTVLQNGVESDSWEKGIGFDGGKTGRTDADGLLANSNSCDSPADAPSAAITGILRAAWNYVYLHNPNIRHWNGTLDQLTAANLTDAQRKRKWITNDNYLLKRWDFCERRFVDAGLWNEETHAYNPINIFEAIGSPTSIQDDQDAVIAAYVAQIVAEARPTNSDESNGIGAYFKAKSLRFHYAFQNHFIAGTDNCSKNTYYVIDPVTHLIELHQDDVDTTIATDNFGFQTKPYYVDRMNPWDDKDTVRAENSSCYDGMLNTLFDLVEGMWAENGAIANAVGSIFGSMLTLTGGIGSSESDEQSGVWKTLNRYLFDIQRYFPQVAFNETARIRYEFPAMLGFIGRNGEADPLAQSMGDQLEAEIQFMKRRLIYMASYAGFGEFAASVGTSTGSIGIGDAAATLAVNSVELPNGGTPDQTFTVVPHQYLFPVFTWQGQTDATRHRTAPGEAYTHTTTFQFANTYPIELRGLNYFRSVGNIGDKTINASSFQIQGSRLTEFKAEPTTYYSTTNGGGSITRAAYEALTDEEKAGYAPAFSRPANLQIADGSNGATRLRSFSLNGCTTTGSTALIPLNLTRLTLIESIDLRNTAMQAVTLPQTATLETLQLPAGMTAVNIQNCASLESLSIQGYASLSSFVVKGCLPLRQTTRLHVLNMKRYAEVDVTRIDIDNIDWQEGNTVDGDTMRWLLDVGDDGVCNLSGRILMASTSATPDGRLYYEDVARLIRRYGNIYDQNIAITDSGLFVDFAKTSITAEMLAIKGRKYINPSELDDPTIVGGSVTGGYFNELDLIVNGTGNNVAAVQKTDGTWTPNVVWTIETSGQSSYVEIQDQYSPSLHVIQVDSHTVVIRATVTDVNGNTRYVEKKIGLWRRIPQVGDFAWTDGEFDNENDASKFLAGLVVMRQMYTSEDVLTTDVTECAYYKLWIYSYCGGTSASSGSVTMRTSTDGTSANYSGVSTQNWGMYPVTGGNSNGLDDTKQNGVYVDGLLAAIATATGRSDIFDTPLTNRSGDVYLRKDAAAVSAAGGGLAMQDETKSDGWATQSASYMTNFNSEGERDTLLAYADTVLQAVLDYMNISDDDLPANCKDSEGHTHPQTPQALADLTQMLVKYADDHGVANPTRYREFMFPAARLAETWCPFDVTANSEAGLTMAMLDEQYKRGKWMLPSSALLARIFNFVGNSRSGYNTSAAPSSTYANESNSLLEAQLPVFANAIARGRTVPVSYSSNQWSSTETGRSNARGVGFNTGGAGSYGKYTGSVVRPVAAFKFVP